MIYLKIAIPTEDSKGLDGMTAMHFGRSKTYTIINEKGELIEVIDNSGEHMGGNIPPPEILKKNGIAALICKGLGPKALNLFEEFGIDVFICQENTVKDMFNSWKSKRLSKATKEETCKEHRT